MTAPDDAAPAGDDAAPAGDDAAPVGDDAAPAGVEIAPAGAELAVQRRALAELWVAVTDAGGAVGFRPPVDVLDVTPVVDGLLAELASGPTRCLAARDREGSVIGLVTVTPGPAPRMSHRVTLGRLMVHPAWQGGGHGARLGRAAHQLAVDEFGAEMALVHVRDGLDLDRFYTRLGYAEVGRIAHGLRFADGDRVDEIVMRRTL